MSDVVAIPSPATAGSDPAAPLSRLPKDWLRIEGAPVAAALIWRSLRPA